jgi:hypothetical protein
MLGTQRLLFGIVIAAANVSFGNATTVRYMHEWSYEKQADYLVLRYLPEVWDTESTEAVALEHDRAGYSSSVELEPSLRRGTEGGDERDHIANRFDSPADAV